MTNPTAKPGPHPAPPGADPDSTPARTGVGSAAPASVWLCVPGPGQDDPDGPLWARRTVEAFSRPGDRVIIRAVGSYPGLAGEAAALLDAARRAARRPLALLPTPAAAARTRTLTHHQDLAPSGVGVWRVGVGRRRPSTLADPAALVVVLAGPLTPGARPPRRRITPRLVQAWTRPLRPRSVLVVLRPPELGLGRRPAQPHEVIVAAAQDAGLAYLQHIVLVHTATTATGLAHPAATRRPHAPFWPVHTDALIFQRPPDPTDPQPAPDTSPPTPTASAAEPVPAGAPHADPPPLPLAPATGEQPAYGASSAGSAVGESTGVR